MVRSNDLGLGSSASGVPGGWDMLANLLIALKTHGDVTERLHPASAIGAKFPIRFNVSRKVGP